jgi:hypothetical protein
MQYVALLVGVLALVLGAGTQAGTLPNVIALGFGASLLASVAFVVLTASRDRIGQHFLSLGLQMVFLDRASAFTNDDWADLVGGANLTTVFWASPITATPGRRTVSRWRRSLRAQWLVGWRLRSSS